MTKLQVIKKEWENVTKFKLFEIEVTRKDNNETDYIIFDIQIIGNKLVAQHFALNKKEDRSKKIAFKSIKIDPDFSLDHNLQELFDECQTAIIDSEYFILN